MEEEDEDDKVEDEEPRLDIGAFVIAVEKLKSSLHPLHVLFNKMLAIYR